MLANSKDVNYLMLNGEVFGSEKRFPGKYTFGKYHIDVNIYNVNVDPKNGPIVNKSSDTATISLAESIVFQELNFKNEKYVLVKSFNRYVKLDNDLNVVGYLSNDIVWVKLADLGGKMTPIN